jgi:hypothetical protein
MHPVHSRPISDIWGDNFGYTKRGRFHLQVAHLLLIHLLPHTIFLIMKYQCPLCPKKFTSRNMLRQHTGTNDAALRRVHLCTKCEQKFCSQRAMEQHRDDPSHDTMFNCDVCRRPFGSRKAVEQHNKKSSLHARRLAQTNHAAENVVGASSNPRNVGSKSRNAKVYMIQTLRYVRGFILPDGIP